MNSIRVSNRLESIEDEESTSKFDENSQYGLEEITKTTRALSLNEDRSSTATTANNANNGRLKLLYTRLKRRFSITRDYRTRSEDMNRNISVRFSNYKPFSSTIDDPYNEFEWPDFEKVYDNIPVCLAQALPGLDDHSFEENDQDNVTINIPNIETDETNDEYNLFKECKRGKDFRRNAICPKLDKTQYNGQLDTFIQQLMIEKLMRTWT